MALFGLPLEENPMSKSDGATSLGVSMHGGHSTTSVGNRPLQYPPILELDHKSGGLILVVITKKVMLGVEDGLACKASSKNEKQSKLNYQ